MSELPYANKSLGQHWLTDFSSLSAMCDAVSVQDGDVVLEVGPGLGSLTELLVERADRVIAVEFDKKLAAELPRRVPESNLEVVSQDILSFDLTNLPNYYKLVANIPYYLTSNLIRVLSESSNPPVAAAILIQKEVAERVAAKPGDMSLLSITAQYYWETSLGIVMPARLFTPPPKVDSQILILNRRPTPLFPDVEPKQFFRLVKAGFSNRRKTLHNSLSGGLQLDKPTVLELLTAAGIKPTSRPQELSLEKWHDLYVTVYPPLSS
jgi:16S rRNA (adenine1518-N6/adenine1519-N6)-dimethyltransferase